MQLLNNTQLIEDRATIQLLHSRLGLDLARSMAYHTGNFWHIEFLNIKNQLIGEYLEILSLFNIRGDAEATNHYNVLTLTEIESIIDDCYRQLEEYNVVTFN